MSKTLENHIESIKQRGYTILNLDELKSCNSKVTYICNCGEKFTKMVKDCVRRGCKKCNSKKTHTIPTKPEYIDEKTGEIWKPILGGWISSFGNAKNALGKLLNLCDVKYRYHIGGKNQYASRLVAITFQIENYELLLDDTQKYIVSHRDKNPKNNKVENLYVRSKIDIGNTNGKKSRKSEKFAEKINWDVNKFADLESRIVPDLPNHLIYSNGEILNIKGKRFLCLSKTIESNKEIDNLYYHFNTNDKQYKVHRLVCYAFHPLPDKKTLDDYDELQVNHIDGDKSNNSSDNLEWMTPSENQAYNIKSGLKRGQAVIQLSKETGEKINQFASIAEASRTTGDRDHAIRSGAKGKPNRNAKYVWKFVDENYALECSKKYSAMLPKEERETSKDQEIRKKQEIKQAEESDSKQDSIFKEDEENRKKQDIKEREERANIRKNFVETSSLFKTNPSTRTKLGKLIHIVRNKSEVTDSEEEYKLLNYIRIEGSALLNSKKIDAESKDEIENMQKIFEVFEYGY